MNSKDNSEINKANDSVEMSVDTMSYTATGGSVRIEKMGRVARFRQYIFVIKELTAREIKRKYARSSLGILWSVLNPLLTMVVMSLIFSTMFKRNIENFPIYYLTGQMLWNLFSGATNSAMSVLVDNKSLLIKAKLPKHVFILSRVYTAFVNFLYTFIAFVFMLAVFRVEPSWWILLLPVDVLLITLISIGIGYLLATQYVFFADIKYLYSVFLTLLMYMSAIFYPVDGLNTFMLRVVTNNPVYMVIALARSHVMYGELGDSSYWIKLCIWTVIILVVGMTVFKVKENQVMQKV